MAERQYRLKMIETLKKIQSTEGPKDFWNMIKKMNQWGEESADSTEKIPPKICEFYDLRRTKSVNLRFVQQSGA